MQITFKPDGTAQHVGRNDLLAGSVAKSKTKRASNILPANWLLRLAFQAIRSIAEDDSALAGWTRRWLCLWQVNIVDGPVLPKLYADRFEAIQDEIIWLEENRL